VRLDPVNDQKVQHGRQVCPCCCGYPDPIQQSEIVGGADIYHGLGGNDVVTLPNVANYDENVGSGGMTLG
jgi:hypothetical protein